MTAEPRICAICECNPIIRGEGETEAAFLRRKTCGIRNCTADRQHPHDMRQNIPWPASMAEERPFAAHEITERRFSPPRLPGAEPTRSWSSAAWPRYPSWT